MKHLLVFTLLFIWGFLSMGHLKALDSFSEKSYKTPKREISLILTDEGVYPDSIFVYEGEEVSFYLTSTTTRPSCFMVPSHNVFVGVQPGKVHKTSLKFEKEGEVSFHCPSGNISGKISIHEHPAKKRERQRRELASERQQRSDKIKIWTPKDDMDRLYEYD